MSSLLAGTSKLGLFLELISRVGLFFKFLGCKCQLISSKLQFNKTSNFRWVALRQMDLKSGRRTQLASRLKIASFSLNFILI